MNTLGEIISRNTRLFPDKLAYSYEQKTLTHRQYAERCFRFGNVLADGGVMRQQRIAFLGQNCLEAIETAGAAEYCGIIMVNLNWRLAPRELVEIVADCTPAVLVFESQFSQAAVLVRQRLPECRMIEIGKSVDWSEHYEDLLAAAPPEPPAMRACSDDVAYLIYTSGTTGRPKGVMVTHSGFLVVIQSIIADCSAAPTDRKIIFMPLFHGGGKIQQMVWSMLGAPIFLHRSFNPDRALEAIAENRITSISLAPAMLQSLLRSPDLERHDLSSLKMLLYSSSPISLPLLKETIARFGQIMYQVYSLTECNHGTVLRPEDHVSDGSDRSSDRLNSVGQPSRGVEVRIVDSHRRTLTRGEVGEVALRSAAAMRGYWNNHSATNEALDQGWCFTGDMGHLNENDFLFLVDRKKDMIISGGENIYPSEVEKALLSHHAVEDVAVFGIPDERWGEAVKAHVVLKDGLRATADELIDHCRSVISSYKKPKSITFVEQLPKTFNGKVDRKLMRQAHLLYNGGSI